jgi:hypothetical protein
MIETIEHAMLAMLDAPLPKARSCSRACTRAGGCSVCFGELLAALKRLRFAIQSFEEFRDREIDELHFGTPQRRKPQ